MNDADVRETSPQPWAAYVGTFPFPTGAPSSQRVLGLARSVAAAGYDVRIYSREAADLRVLRSEGGCWQGNITSEGRLEELPSSRLCRVFGALFLDGGDIVEWLGRQEPPPNCVIAYGLSAPILIRLRRYSARTGVPVVADVVEWYELGDVQGGRWGPWAASVVVGRSVLSRWLHGYIAISRELERRLERRQVPVVRIPPTQTPRRDNTHVFSQADRRMRLAYCGTPGKKELLEVMLRGAALADPHGHWLQFSIAGPDAEWVRRATKHLGAAPDLFKALGPVDQGYARDLVSRSDYTILVRAKRYANQAGFSTKFVESLSAGTPVIGNITGDLAEHLVDGLTGWRIANESPEAVADALRRAHQCDDRQYQDMRVASELHAQQEFAPEGYVNQSRDFLLQVTSEQTSRGAE